VRAYATNSYGTGYGNEISFTTTGTAVPTVISGTGKIWMDRNLGAAQVATTMNDVASYGDLYQWGRGSDGHQRITSATTTTLSDADAPGNGNFILNTSTPFDWRSPQNDNLWQGVTGTNNPCPCGFRIPTVDEFSEEFWTWGSVDDVGAFSSPLKFPLAGIRDNSLGLFHGLAQQMAPPRSA
jgi:hypothetical protein